VLTFSYKQNKIHVNSVKYTLIVNSDNVCFLFFIQTVALPAVGGCVGKGSLGDGIPPAGSGWRSGGHKAKPPEAEAIH